MHGVCDHHGCNDIATRRPTIRVTARPPHNTYVQRPAALPAGEGLFDQGVDGPTRYVVEYEICLAFCDHHAGMFQWKKFVDEACWSAIENQLRQTGMAPPSKDEVDVTWAEAAGPDGLDEIGRKMVAINQGRELKT